MHTFKITRGDFTLFFGLNCLRPRGITSFAKYAKKALMHKAEGKKRAEILRE
jgi:hypothetical protein